MANIFVKAGTIESVKIIPSKVPDSATTFGFVRFKTKTAAMKAIQMFNNHKIGSQSLKVRFAKPSSNSATVSNNKNNGSGDNQCLNKGGSDVENEDWNDIPVTATKPLSIADSGSKSRLDSESLQSNTMKPKGRGQIINSIREKCNFSF